MKTKQKLFGLSAFIMSLSLIFSISFFSCSDSGGSGTPSPAISKVFTVEGAELMSGNFPDGSGSGPGIGNVSGNSHVLPGGTNSVSINTDDEVTHALIGISGMAGYFQLPVESAKSSELTIVIYILVDPDIDVEEFTIVLALMNGTTVGIHETLDVDLVEAGTGQLQVSLSWDQPVDLDLYLVEPNGTTIYYGNRYSENGGELDIDSNAGCSDGIQNENITYNEDAIVEAGEYIVRVNLWSECGVSEQINYTASTRVDGNIIPVSWGNNPKHSNYPAGSTGAGGGAEAGEEVMKFNISSSKLTDVQTYTRFSFPAKDAKDYPDTK